MASSSEVGPERCRMNAKGIPVALVDRLGHDATLGLVDLLDAEESRWSERVLNTTTDRFERRLTEEISALRVDLGRELQAGLAGVRQELATTRVELLKWSFLFWLGQVGAMAGLLAFMLHRTGP